MGNNQIDINKIISDVISNNVEKLVAGIYKSGTSSWKELTVKTGSAFNNYLETAVEKYSRIKTIIYRERPVPLYDFYVDAKLSHESQTFATSDINELINYNNKILIYGNGGIGKSTLLKHLFFNTLTNTDYIPIYVELRFVNEREQSLLECIYNTIQNLNFNLDFHYFKASLSNGRYVFLLDGLDEVEESRRRRLTNEIIQLTDKYNSNYYFLSSRRGDQLFNGMHAFSDFNIMPFSKESALELIKKLRYDDEIKEKFHQELDRRLYETHRSFCSNPLLLNILMLTFSEFAEIPEKMHIFYRRAFDVLYSQHDATKAGYKRKIKVEKDISSDEFKKVLASVSALSYMDNITYFDNSSLITHIDYSKRLCDCSFNSEDYKHDLIESVCMLVVDGLNYKYQHRSFQEYFTAEFILSLNEDSMHRILRKLFMENGSTIETDLVFDLMLDMDKDKVEKSFIIPHIGEMESSLSTYPRKEAYLRYMMSQFSTVQFDHYLINLGEVEKEEDSFTFTYKEQPEYFTVFINYIYNKYVNQYPEWKPVYPYGEDVSVPTFKEYATEDIIELRHSVELNLSILEDKILTEQVLKISSRFIDSLEFCFFLKNKLEEKHSKKEEARDILFKINR